MNKTGWFVIFVAVDVVVGVPGNVHVLVLILQYFAGQVRIVYFGIFLFGFHRALGDGTAGVYRGTWCVDRPLRCGTGRVSRRLFALAVGR